MPGTPHAFRSGMQPHSRLLTSPHSTQVPARRERFVDEPVGGFYSCSLEVSIRADIRRLFHALTVPEYMEAWLSVPGERPGCATVAVRSNDDYVIEHFCEGRPSFTMSGRYRVCRRRSVAFSWRIDGDLSVPETEVEIRLRGDFERTTLALRHTGFASRHDSAWHEALWNASMGRLVSFYGSSNGSGLPSVWTAQWRGSRTG